MAQVQQSNTFSGLVVRLDRGFPLVRLEDGREIRCEHAIALVKGKDVRACVGDNVTIEIPDGHDKGIIADVLERRTSFVRKDPTERSLPQTLAANFDIVLIAQPIKDVNLRRLERELVLAHETGADVGIILTKADLAEGGEVERVVSEVGELAGDDRVFVLSAADDASVEAVRAYIAEGNRIAILIGRSGVGKSTLVNLLVGHEVQATTPVRERDGKGRHTTVSREMLDLPGGGSVVDMPGVRGLGLWDASAGIAATFPEIEAAALECRFRDCSHNSEPGCAVRAALESGELSAVRVDSYKRLQAEQAEILQRRTESSWRN
jgi:ribosome biogenesis GTPase